MSKKAKITNVFLVAAGAVAVTLSWIFADIYG